MWDVLVSDKSEEVGVVNVIPEPIVREFFLGEARKSGFNNGRLLFNWDWNVAGQSQSKNGDKNKSGLVHKRSKINQYFVFGCSEYLYEIY